jgi:hypothetical protein
MSPPPIISESLSMVAEYNCAMKLLEYSNFTTVNALVGYE